PGNLALRRNVTQSSTYGVWFAAKAVDGYTSPVKSWNACSSTTNETNPWWRLDLSDTYRVTRVVITNIKECCAERINGAEIRIGNSLENNGNNNPICAVIPSIPAGVSSTYTCNDTEGGLWRRCPCLKQTFVKVKLKSKMCLFQLESALAGRGISNVTLRWSQLPEQEVLRKKAAPGECVHTRNTGKLN
ncbi:hypothetical protein PO909_024956, partial [Leuciscus waleckii]